MLNAEESKEETLVDEHRHVDPLMRSSWSSAFDITIRKDQDVEDIAKGCAKIC